MPSPNLLNPANDPIVEARLKKGLLNFGTALATGGPGVPGDIGQGAVSGITGLLNARMNSIDPTGRVRGMAGQHGLLSAPEVPFSSEAMQKKLGGDPRAPESLLGFMGAPDVTDVGKIVSAAAAKGLLDPSLAHTLFHGTPHKFDMFDLKAIGTGEGAQAYGHGLYFAESPGVAKNYTNAGWVPDKGVEINGERLIGKQRSALDADAQSYAIDALTRFDGDKKQALDFLADGGPMDDDAMRWIEQNVKGTKAKVIENPGHLYEVDIPDEVTAKMLDWDAPLSEQPESVRKAAQRLIDSDPTIGPDDAKYIQEKGEHFYQALRLHKPDGVGNLKQEGASEWLNEAGIPGIRFYDANSRLSARPFKQVKRSFLDALPENADFDEVMELVGTGQFTREQDEVLKALEADDWLGFDYPSQSVNAAYADNVRNWDPSDRLLKALDESAGGESRTHNIVVFNPDDITHVKRDGELVYKTKGL